MFEGDLKRQLGWASGTKIKNSKFGGALRKVCKEVHGSNQTEEAFEREFSTKISQYLRSQKHNTPFWFR